MFNIIAFLGPSGSGKTTLQRELGVTPVVTWTSRPPREGEIHGKDYFFSTQEDILEMYSKGLLLEYTQYNGNYYGMGTEYINNIIDSGEQGSVVVDANGAQILKQKYPDYVLVVGVYASFKECKERLVERSNKEDYLKRLETYGEEVDYLYKFSDIIIINSSKNWNGTKEILKELKERAIN